MRCCWWRWRFETQADPRLKRWATRPGGWSLAGETRRARLGGEPFLVGLESWISVACCFPGVAQAADVAAAVGCGPRLLLRRMRCGPRLLRLRAAAVAAAVVLAATCGCRPRVAAVEVLAGLLLWLRCWPRLLLRLRCRPRSAVVVSGASAVGAQGASGVAVWAGFGAVWGEPEGEPELPPGRCCSGAPVPA